MLWYRKLFTNPWFEPRKYTVISMVFCHAIVVRTETMAGRKYKYSRRETVNTLGFTPTDSVPARDKKHPMRSITSRGNRQPRLASPPLIARPCAAAYQRKSPPFDVAVLRQRGAGPRTAGDHRRMHVLRSDYQKQTERGYDRRSR